MGKRRPRFGLRLTSGIVVDRRLSAAAKLRVGVSAFLAGHDPSRRALEDFLPFTERTIVAGDRQLETFGYARIVRPQRPRDRLIVVPAGLALPGQHGRHRYATIGPDLARAAFSAASGRSATAYAQLVLQRLLREQLKRKSAHIAPPVVAADVGISLKLALALLDDLTFGNVIERHRSHGADNDELRVYSCPLGEYRIDLDSLDEDESRLVERIAIEGHELTVIGRRGDLAAIPLRLSELRQAIPPQAIEAAVAAAISENISGPAILVGDLLDLLRPPKDHISTATKDDFDRLKTPFRPPLLKHQASSSKQMRYAEEEDEGAGYAHAEAAAPARAEELSGEEERVHRAPPATGRAEAQRYEAPYCSIVGYTATATTHERIVTLLDAVAAASGDGEAREAAYQAVYIATGEWSGGAKGSDVLAYLRRRFDRYDPDEQEPDAGLDFGAFGVADE